MRAIIIYYSYTGNTKKIADILAEYLKQRYEVKLLRLEALDYPTSFFAQAARALFHKRPKISTVEFNLSGYDLICLGTPVWAFAPAPAMNTYLDECSGINTKDIILFTTYGCGAGNNRCLNYMQSILAQKGARHFFRFSIQQSKVQNKEFVLLKIKDLRL
jgi:flavodoxin